ncbi:MAG: T9SS type A sorting domain-containing protein [Crocinitomicaceae bacterium]
MKKIISAVFTILIFSGVNIHAKQEDNRAETESGGCGLFIEEIHVFPGGHVNYMYPHFKNVSADSPSNYADYTLDCILNCTQPAIAIHASESNYFLSIYLDNDGNGSFETLAHSQFSTTSVQVIFQLSAFVNQSAGMRIIISDQAITNANSVPNCGEMEDYVFCESCLPPQNTQCTPHNKFDYQTLSWQALQNAVAYEVTLAYNDPQCCSGPQQAIQITTTTTASTQIQIPFGNCFSWSVEAIFANGTTSPSSPFECSCEILSPAQDPVPTPTDGTSSRQLDGNQEVVNEGFKMDITPNPASEIVQITVFGQTDLSERSKLVIYDISGKEVYQSSISFNEMNTVDVSAFTSGAYIVKIIDQSTVRSTQKMIIQ